MEKNESCCSVTKSCSNLHDSLDSSMPGFPVPDHLPEFAQVHIHWIDDAVQPPHPLYSLLLLPSTFPSIRVFSSESAVHIQWPKFWSLNFSFSVSPSKEYSGLISFKIDWFDLLVSKGPQESSQEHLLHLQYIREQYNFCSGSRCNQINHLSLLEIIQFSIRCWIFLGLNVLVYKRELNNNTHVPCAQSYPTLCDPMDYNLLVFSVDGIFQAKLLQRIAISFSRGSSPPRD